MQNASAAMAEKTASPNVEARQEAVSQDGTRDGTQSRKRLASVTMERSPAKAAKPLASVEQSLEASVVTVTTAGDGGESQKPSYEELEKEAKAAKDELKSMKDKANTIIKAKNSKINELTDRALEAEAELAQVQVELKHLRSSRGSGNLKELTAQITENVNKKTDKKIADLTAKHQKANDALKSKAQDAHEEAKEAKAEFAEKQRELKKEYADLKKELKAEQQEEIQKAKAEDSKELREKKELVRVYQKKLNAHENETVKSGEEIGGLQAEIDNLSKFKRKAHEKIRDLQLVNQKERDFSTSIGQEYGAKTVALEQKLVHEGKRWQKQKEVCDQLTEKLVTQQQTNFVLRNANDSKVKKLQKVMAEMQRLRGMAPGEGRAERAEEQGVDAETQTGEPRNGENGAGAKEAEAEKEAEQVESPHADAGLPETDRVPTKTASQQQEAANLTTAKEDVVYQTSALTEKAETPNAQGFLTPKEGPPVTCTKTAEGLESMSTEPGKEGDTNDSSIEKMHSPMEEVSTPKEGLEGMSAELGKEDNEVGTLGFQGDAEKHSLEPNTLVLDTVMSESKKDKAGAQGVAVDAEMK